MLKRAQQSKIVLVTAPDLKTARNLARCVLEQRLAACANLIPRIESHYWWRGKLERSTEMLVLFKTTAERLKGLERIVLDVHPYDTPEFLVLPIAAGNHRYLAWLAERRLG